MDQEIKWSAPEFHFYDKGVVWYWLIVLTTIIIVALALWQKNFLFAIFIIIASMLVITWGRQEPRTIDFTLSEKGLDIGEKQFIAFKDLAGFNIIETHDNEEINELVLKSNKKVIGWTKVIIAKQRKNQINNLIEKHIPKIEYEESLADHLARILKF